ncbi:hypothetical protein SETIT_4G066300v2 [Setaria italica]|uniref:PGG domain-containing protein n=1 Tax=Setaria italica TaxID=4555 RepID=A0A368QRI3_SETIT|nr:hypothetical protein SETIT_4G066300v2 [Setaria italica]
MPKQEETSPPSPDVGEVVDGAPPAGGSALANKLPRDEVDAAAAAREKWFDEMRGWIMTLAVLVASVTYSAGLNPPGGFWENSGIGHEAGAPVLQSINPIRYNVFFYSNTTAFLTLSAIIVLLMNRSFYASKAKVVAPEIIVVLDMVGLNAAYWAGSTRAGHTDLYTLVLIDG